MAGDSFKANIWSKLFASQLRPGFENIFDQFNVMSGMPNYGAPSMSGRLTGIPMYGLPNVVGPTSQWWNTLSPEIKAGAWAPYEDAANQLGERMGASGQLGNARVGYSGASGAAFGDFYADAGKDYAMNLWNMSAPGLMSAYNAELGRNIAGYNTALAEKTTDYNTEMQAWQMPWNLATNYNQLVPSGAYHSDSGGTLNSIMGAGTSVLGPIGMGWGMGGFKFPGFGGTGGKGGASAPFANSYGYDW